MTGIPETLREQVQKAFSALLLHPLGALAPIYRLGIYRKFLALGKPTGHARISLVTARYVLPIWQAERPYDSTALDILRTSEVVLAHHNQHKEAAIFAGAAWEVVDRLSVQAETPSAKRAFRVGEAAIVALQTALGRDPFTDVIVSDTDTDEDLDPWSSDTAKWASAAYAGRVGEAGSDNHMRLEFWSWWLNEAIPIAWNVVG